MDWATFIGPGVGFLGAGVVLFVRWWLTTKTSGFASVAKAVLSAIDKIPHTDDVKHELSKDIFDVFRQYLSPADPAPDMKAMMQEVMADFLKGIQATLAPTIPTPVAAPAK